MIMGRVRSSSPYSCPRFPAHLVEWDPAPRIQPNSFPFQEQPLDQVAAWRGPGTYPPSRIYNPMPGHDGPVRQGVEGIPDLARVSGQAGERRNLSVRRYLALGNPPDHAINPLVAHQAGEIRRAASCRRPGVPARQRSRYLQPRWERPSSTPLKP